MYRIRRQTGDELTLASIDELAAAVAAGRVTADAEIYHQRADRWLAIASHPHFKLASERAHAAPPARQSAPPAPAPEAAETPALRLVKDEESPRVTARWKEPPRLVKQPVALRAPSAAVPAVQPAPDPEPAPEAKAEPSPQPTPAPRPRTHVQRATDGLPLLDVEALPPIPPRAPTPAPTARPLFDAEKLGLKPATPMPQRAPTPAPAPKSEPRSRQVPTPGPTPSLSTLPPVRPMMPVAEESLDVPPPVRDFSAPYTPPAAVQPTPAPAPVVVPPVAVAEPTPAPRAPTPMPSPLPQPMALPEFAAPIAAVSAPIAEPVMAASVVAPEPVAEVAAPEPEIELIVDAAVADEEPVVAMRDPAPMSAAARARWPMLVGALAMLGAIGFIMTRPRATVDPLAPQHAAAAQRAQDAAAPAPAQAVTQAATTPVAPPAPERAGRKPAYVVDLPEAPSPAPAAQAVEEEPVVPAAPTMAPSATIGGLAPQLEIDPTAEARRRSLEQTRRQIDQQLRAQP